MAMSVSSREIEFIVSSSLFHTKLQKKIDSQLSCHGISFTEYLIMNQLNIAPNKTMRRIELAESIGITASGVTRLLAPMEKIKLVKKEVNPRDARVSLVKLTKVGELLFEDATVSFGHGAKMLMEPLSGNQLDKLIELTNRVM